MVETDIYQQEYGVVNMEVLNLLELFKNLKTYTIKEHIKEDFWKDILAEDIKNISADVELTISPKGYKSYNLNLYIKANIRANCSVCLKEFEFDINIKDNFELLDKELESYSKSHFLKEEEFSTYYIDQENFNPSDIIIDTVLGSIPIKLLCQVSCTLKPDKKAEQKNKSFDILKGLLTKEDHHGSTKA